MKQRLCPNCNTMIKREVVTDNEHAKVYIKYICHDCKYQSVKIMSTEEYDKSIVINLKDVTS